MIGSRLELDSNVVTTCRIAFSAQLAVASFFDRQRLKVVKLKSKLGTVERLHDPNTLIVKNLFKKETNFDLFNRLEGAFCPSHNKESSDSNFVVELSTGESAKIDGTFGTTGKVKITNSSGFSDSTQNATRKAKKGETVEKKEPITVKLNFYKNIFATDKNSILQLWWTQKYPEHGTFPGRIQAQEHSELIQDFRLELGKIKHMIYFLYCTLKVEQSAVTSVLTVECF